MKRRFATAAAALGIAAGALTAPTTADAAPAITPHTAAKGSLITYTYWSDTARNTFSYYGQNGTLMKRTYSHFGPNPSGHGREKYRLRLSHRASTKQPAGTEITSRGSYARCEVRINGRIVDAAANGSGGSANC